MTAGRKEPESLWQKIWSSRLVSKLRKGVTDDDQPE
jgi:hypothetical protein